MTLILLLGLLCKLNMTKDLCIAKSLKQNTMKSVSKMGVTIILMMALMTPGVSGVKYEAAKKRSEPIIIRQEPTDPIGAPRTPFFNPFIAELMDGNTTVFLGATNACGTVFVQITSTAGDNYSTYFDSSDGSILLPISSNAGYYTLTIITPDGTHYVGKFSI